MTTYVLQARSFTFEVPALIASTAFDVATAPQDQGVAEIVPWGFDFSAVLAAGESITSVASVCTVYRGGAVVIIPNPSVNGNIVTQLLPGNDLTSGQIYSIVVTATTNMGHAYSCRLLVNAI